MDASLELRKYHLIEQLMNLTDRGIIKEIEKIIYSDETIEISLSEMKERASIAEKQLEEGATKTHEEAKEKLSKWMK